MSTFQRENSRCRVVASQKAQMFICLFQSDLQFGGLPPVSNVMHRLLDRVVSVRLSYTVPLGLKGYIIGECLVVDMEMPTKMILLQAVIN